MELRMVDVLLIALLTCVAVVNHVDCHVDKVSPDTGQPPDEDDDVTVETEEQEDRAMYIKYSNDGSEENLFVPTEEWKVVKPGQPIPKGLHVRYNLQTGVYEAKLLEKETESESAKPQHSSSVLQVENPEGDTDEKTSREEKWKRAMEEVMQEMAQSEDFDKNNFAYWKDGDKEGMLNLKNKHFSRDEIKEALKKFKANKDDVQDEKVRAESIKRSFRSYEELRQDLKQMNMGMKTEQEIVSELLQAYNSPHTSPQQTISVLQDLEYYLHQVDNAQQFADLGGFSMLLHELNNTDSSIRSEALAVVAAAVQSNPKVQVTAVDGGLLQQLLRMLALERDATVMKPVLYALSCLLRHFPYAQAKFVQLGGLPSLTGLFSQPSIPAKVKVKAATLLSDLITERKLIQEHTDTENTQDAEKLQQYTQVGLEQWLASDASWCESLAGLLTLTDHDHLEKVLASMTCVQHLCHLAFTQPPVQDALLHLKAHYHELSSTQQDDNSYFTEMLHSVKSLLSQIRNEKDEL